MIHCKRWLAWAGVLFFASANATPGATKAAPQTVDFSAQIRPIISGKCFSCHGADEGGRKAKLRLDLREEAVKERKGGGHAIVPGDAAKSLVYQRIITKDTDDLMPPVKGGHPLTAPEIELIKRWIEEGAAYTGHWAFEKPARPATPAVKLKSWPHNPIDNFVLARLEQNRLKPSPAADRHALIRRATLDLTGLPPTPEEIEAFVKDRDGKAFEKVVDRLLKSSAYGERWARLWLDLARYADSAGYGSDPLRLNIWPYRDWLINAFNRNLPYDQFTTEQIAGDLLAKPTREQLIATAFNRNTMTNTEGGTDDEEWRVAAVKDRIGVTSQVWMGLTMNCAQCHTHKFDPISHTEYYQFYSFFNQTEDNDQPDERPTMPLPTAEEQANMDRLKGEIAAVEAERGKSSPEFEQDFAAWQETARQGTEWTPLKPLEMKSAKGATLAALDDRSILASGAAPETDTYTLKLGSELTNITALRVELLPHESLPGQGPGRAPGTGKAVLNHFQVAYRAAKDPIPTARFVRVELPGQTRRLSLAEVQIVSGQENVAVKGKASQSSTDEGAEAQRAIDGRTDGNFDVASTTLTETQDSPWWEVDLGAEYPLEEITVWNRTDRGMGTRLNDFKILALDAKRKNVWEKPVGGSPNPSISLRVPPEKSVTLRNASGDYGEPNWTADKAIDGDAGSGSGWSIGGQTGKTHAASFELEAAAGEAGGGIFIVTMTQSHGSTDTLGRFRVSATTQPRPVRILPTPLQGILELARDKRSAAQQEELAAFYRPFSPSSGKFNVQLAKLRKELEGVRPVALPVMRDFPADKQRVSHLFNKGNFLDPGPVVQPAFPVAFNFAPPGAPTNRLGVAQWLMSRDNPLTARVAVNRFWAQLFGTGIVETEEDFGTQGALPSHRELLDWLAVEFRDGGWDMKAILKTIVMSATYQQSTRVTPEALERDPRNRLFSRASRQRLEAEMVRDQALALSGLLSRKMGGPSVYPAQPDGLWRAAFNGERTWSTSKGEDRYRRGLYTFWRRTVPYPSMATFDAPSREQCTVRRLPTNTPLQAFVTMNDPVFVEAAQALGRRLAREGGVTVKDRVAYGLRLALGRPANGEQVKSLVKLYETELAKYQGRADDAKKLATEPLGPLPEGLPAAEAAAWTVVGNVLLNLDGVLTKG